MKQSKNVAKICRLLDQAGINYKTEFRFHDVRRFRFDIAIPTHKIAIEYEGIFSRKSGHTSISGFLSDIEKYNLATMNGWKLLRYTATNFGKNKELLIIEDIKNLMEIK